MQGPFEFHRNVPRNFNGKWLDWDWAMTKRTWMCFSHFAASKNRQRIQVLFLSLIVEIGKVSNRHFQDLKEFEKLINSQWIRGLRARTGIVSNMPVRRILIFIENDTFKHTEKTSYFIWICHWTKEMQFKDQLSNAT